ncbi:ABC transporter substrate-binding protein [Streptococcus pneumoniae]|nr:hypothetical protein [Streptococcus pneumoniae]VMO44646.1 ABC transporter substrate-binding protein [Streptococcus pneumoniae]
MKNKRLIGIIAALAVLVAGSLIYSSMNKSEYKMKIYKSLIFI